MPRILAFPSTQANGLELFWLQESNKNVLETFKAYMVMIVSCMNLSKVLNLLLPDCTVVIVTILNSWSSDVGGVNSDKIINILLHRMHLINVVSQPLLPLAPVLY